MPASSDVIVTSLEGLSEYMLRKPAEAVQLVLLGISAQEVRRYKVGITAATVSTRRHCCLGRTSHEPHRRYFGRVESQGHMGRANAGRTGGR